MSRNDEQNLYEPVQRSLKRLFSRLGATHFEITARGQFGARLKEKLDDVSLHIIDHEGFFPDLMGFVQTSAETYSLVACEVKNEEVKLKDIAQARNYGVVYATQHAILISNEPIPEEIRRWYLGKRRNIGLFGMNASVCVAHYGLNPISSNFPTPDMRILGSSWVPSPPFTPACPTCKSNEAAWDADRRSFYCPNCNRAYPMPSD